MKEESLRNYKEIMMAKKIKAEEQEVSSSAEVDWRTLILNEAEWRIQLLAMLERIATAQEKRNEMLEEEEEDSDSEDET